MADSPLGPNGQPNPFFSQQGAKSDVTINTQPAQAAFADLQKVITALNKNLGTNLKDQEQFYKYIGDKENERRVAVERLKRAAIDSINEETRVQLAAYEERARAEKASTESITKGKIDLASRASQQIANIEAEAAKKSKGPGLAGRALESVQGVAGRIGGPIGGLVSGVANLIAEPEVAIPAAIIGAVLEIANKRAAFTKTGIQLSGAGFGTVGAGSSAAQLAGSGFDLKLFSGLNRALSADEQRNIISGMAGSRTMIGQAAGAGGMNALRGNLGLFANILPDASKEMELFTGATKDLGMSQKDISKLFFQSAKSSKDLGITQLDAISAQLEMQKALRNITNDGTVAANVLDNVGSFFHDIGKSEAETKRMTLGVAGAGANLSLSTMAGMAAFINGGKIPSFSQMFGGPESGIGPSNGGIVGNPFSMMGKFITKIGGQFQDPMQKMFAADALNKQLGLGIQTQDLPQLFKLAGRLGQSGPGGLSQDEFAKQTEALSKKSRELTVAGMDTLTSIVTPINQMQIMFGNFWTQADALFTKYFGSPKGSSIHPVSQSLPNIKSKVNGGKHSSDFDVIQH